MTKLTGLALAAVFSVAAFAVAQNAPSRRTVQLAGGRITVEAGNAQVMGNGTAFSNGIIITVNGVRVFADRAVVEANDANGPTPDSIKLEGNVRLSLAKAQ